MPRINLLPHRESKRKERKLKFLVALGVAAVALLTGGMVVGRLTGRPMLRSGLRQLALGGVAVAVTFAVGSLIGAGHVA